MAQEPGGLPTRVPRVEARRSGVRGSTDAFIDDDLVRREQASTLKGIPQTVLVDESATTREKPPLEPATVDEPPAHLGGVPKRGRVLVASARRGAVAERPQLSKDVL